MKDFWNQRFGQEEYVYGLNPNNYLKEQLEKLTPGTLFLPGDGEGRNAVYAASQGWQVDAMDYAISGQEKALKLAKQQGVDIQYTVSDIAEYPLKQDYYDAMGLIYFHLSREMRRTVFPKIIKGLKPGGLLFMEVYAKEQLGRKSGGPKDLDQLSSLEEVKEDFKDLDIEHLAIEEVPLSEGAYHQGLAMVVRLLGRRP